MTRVGTLADGRAVDELTIAGGGLTARFLTLGSILRDLRLDGVSHRLVLGARDLDAYLASFRFGGALVGPVANRIGKAQAPLGDKVLTLPANEGTTCLHGGPKGLDTQIWTVRTHQPDLLELELSLADGSDGWPGDRQILARWSFPAPGTLALELEATSDRASLFAPAQHGYWNLGPGQDLDLHRFYCAANTYTQIDSAKIPTGKLLEVEGTPFDFRTGGAVGPHAAARIDHNLCLRHARGPLAEICQLQGPSARLTIFSTEPGLQIYDAGHFADSDVVALDGTRLAGFAGLALEPQLWPDAANQPDWQSPRLRPGETYRQETRWQLERL